MDAEHCNSIWFWRRSERGGKLDRADSSRTAQGRPAVEAMLERQTAEDTQAQLLGRVAARDLQALSEFYDQTAAPLFSLALRIIGDASEAEEIVQDVFVQIWEKAATFDAALGSAFHWALSIARHRAIDKLRSRQRRARLTDELMQNAVTVPAAVPAPDEGVSEGDSAAAVRLALSRLPFDQRQAIELAFFGGLTHPEIAETLHQPLGTIKARIRRGLLKLRESLPTNA